MKEFVISHCTQCFVEFLIISFMILNSLQRVFNKKCPFFTHITYAMNFVTFYDLKLITDKKVQFTSYIL